MENKNKKLIFVNFLFSKKHGMAVENAINFREICSLLDISESYKCTINAFLDNVEKCTDKHYNDALNLLDTFFSNEVKSNSLVNDLIFCIINSNFDFLKVFKSNKLRLENLQIVYESAFNENKPFLKEFNAKDKINKEVKKNLYSTPAVTRFAPEPSGCLHIGHLKALLVNYNLAEKSNGTLLLRFDDTNPVKNYEKYEKEILRDLDTLGITGLKISHSSDYFELLVNEAVSLINKNLAYVDNTDQETMRIERFEGIESKMRNINNSESLKIFKELLQGRAPGYCLRAKIDMSNPNKSMRDPVIYRASDKMHGRCKLYKAFPTYDFVCPIVDSIEGVTVVCRANEYKDRNEQYKWFLENLELENKPEFNDFSKLNLEDTVLSKRKIDKLISDSLVTGWDDPRLATIQGIKRLGMHMTALKDYINLQGASNKTNVISWDKIWAMNKKVIDPLSPRFMAVEKINCVRVFITNFEGLKYTKNIPLNKKNTSLGSKDVLFSDTLLFSQEDGVVLKENEEFTLMNWGNAIVEKKVVENSIVTELYIKLHLEGDYKSTTNKISWVSESGAVTATGIEYGNLLVNEEFNINSKIDKQYYVESSITNLSTDMKHVQFERIGFFYCDSPCVFHLVPFTKQKRTY